MLPPGYRNLADLFSPAELAEYEQTEYPFNLALLNKTLKEKLKEDPTYEVWVPLVYYRYTPYLRKDTTFFAPHKVFFSNQGRFLSCRGKEPYIVQQHIGKEGYWMTGFRLTTKKVVSVRTHRAMACCFVPIENGQHPRDMQVNHIDTNKQNFAMANLEWVTPLGNVQHALSFGLGAGVGISNGLTKPVKGTILKGPLTGTQFILAGVQEMTANGFQQSNISHCLKGRLRKHKGCSWTYATEEEVAVLPRGLPS